MKKTVVITGAAGFIGYNLAKKLLEEDKYNILLVEDVETLKDKWHNVKNLYPKISWMDYRSFLFSGIEKVNPVIVHLGANSSTTERDVGKIIEQNVTFTQNLITKMGRDCKIIFASSASVYGNMQLACGSEMAQPLCPYAYTKYLCDKFIANLFETRKLDYNIASLRFFNVYGRNGEEHKGGQASVFHKFTKELITQGEVCLFKSPGWKRISRDFVCVKDVCSVIEFFIEKNDSINGIYDVGTGKDRTYEEVTSVCYKSLTGFAASPKRRYMEIPESLMNSYQYYTKANLTALKQAGYNKKFKTIEEGWS